MALIQEVEQFITESGLTADQAGQMRAIFEASPTAQEKVKGGLLRQSDYSKHLNNIKTAEDDLKAKETKLNDEFARLSQYGIDADGKVLTAQRAVEAAEAKVVKAQNRAKRWAETYGVPAEEVTEVFGTETTTETKPQVTAPTGDDAPLTIAEFKRQAGDLMLKIPYMGAVQNELLVEYYNLFGKMPDPKSFQIVVKQAIDSGKTLRDVASEYYKFSEKQDQLKEATIEEKYRKKYDQELQTRLSEAHLPTSTRPAPTGAKIFNVKPQATAPATTAATTTTATTQAARVDRANSVRNQMSTVQKAANAFREGKYAPKT